MVDGHWQYVLFGIAVIVSLMGLIYRLKHPANTPDTESKKKDTQDKENNSHPT